ncbi:DUF742 domain-containing protein [Saccharopolyspora sp. HNM0983]|uniref:DUF742 domain-containing protein n=1 Tax=Saccharopolyspora montiporae TaxID=2781240 RepID=A0A929G331_9PSEU|nr:DUF742 domain-containing protein [Saccharopolyspora sp. HNM0983]MBE9376478.1 DUF742 domain-containing protein [Saccharopolyspora sp. HNM0983]
MAGPLEHDNTPDRFYTVTGGRTSTQGSSLDVVTLIVSECDPAPGMQSESVRILELCRHPMAVAEIASHLNMPISVVKILLCDLLDTNRVTARQPSSAARRKDELPAPELLEQVLVGLQNI